MDIHDYKTRLERALRQVDTELNKENATLIKDYIRDRKLEGLSPARLVKLIEVLRLTTKRLGKNLDEADINDLKDWAGLLEQLNYSPESRATHRAIVKKFYKWIYKTEDGYPSIVSWMRTSTKKRERKLLNDTDLLTPEEIIKAVNECSHPRDKALLAVLAETGARIGEVGNLLLKNIHIDDKGAILNLYGKTGSRRVRIVSAVSHLVTWINTHPYKKDPEAPLWTRLDHRKAHCVTRR